MNESSNISTKCVAESVTCSHKCWNLYNLLW